MRSIIIIFLLLLAGLYSFSFGQNKLNRTDYVEKINQVVCHLSCDPNDPQAAKKLLKTYSNALMEYQGEIDRLQVASDSFKWTNTYDLMNELNELSNEILFNSAANRIICEPKVYTHELAEVKQKAIQELYDAGIKSLRNGSKAKAKAAYWYFVKVEQLSPAFKDVVQKIQQAKRKATLNVVVEKVAAYAYYKNLFSTNFYQAFFDKLHSEFLYDRFVNIYSYKEAKQRKIETVDWYVRVSFIDFEIQTTKYYSDSQFINLNGVSEIKIFSTIEKKDILSTRFPGQFVWKSYDQGSKSDLQGLLDSFSLSMKYQVYDVVSRFIKQSNY